MRGSIKRLVGYALTTFFVIWASFVIVDRWEMMPNVHWDLARSSLIIVSVLTIVVLNSFLIEECAQLVGQKIGFVKSVIIGFIVTSANYILPMRGGLLIRLAAYSRFAGHDAVALGSVLTSSALFTQFLYASLLAILISIHIEIPSWYWIALTGAAILPVSAYFAWPIIRRAKFHKYELITRITEGSHLFYGQSGVVATKVAFISIAALSFTAARYVLIGDMLNPMQYIAISTSLAIASAASISSMISVTAGGFGIREGAVVLVAGLFGLPPGTGLLIALIDRMFVTLIIVPAGIYSVIWAKKGAFLS